MKSALEAGQHLAGRFRVDAQLGCGELGEVYAAMDTHGPRPCAIKLLSPHVLSNPAAWSDFQTTARKVGNVVSSSIARPSDFGIDANLGRPFFVSEHITFPSVASLIQQAGPLSVPIWSHALRTLCQALDFAAAAGVSHGNLKPENLFVAVQNPAWARITDFGTAALRRACPPPSGAAALGWTAPEQSQGASESPASDVFALGLLTFYALTARHYLRAMWQPQPSLTAVQAELFMQRGAASRHAEALGAQLPVAFDAWFSRALHAQPAARFDGAQQAALAFQAAAMQAGYVSAQQAVSASLAPPSAPAAQVVLQTLPRQSVEARPLAPTLVGDAAFPARRMETLEAPPIGQVVVLAETVSSFPAAADTRPPASPAALPANLGERITATAARGRRLPSSWLLIGLAVPILAALSWLAYAFASGW